MASSETVAVAIHAFYPDLLDDVLVRIAQLGFAPKLFVTTVADKFQSVDARIRLSGLPYSLTVVENHGRDVLPFLGLLPQISAEGSETVIKVHTKKSLHRRDGDEWRDDVLDSLLNPAMISSALELMKSDANLGMVGPAGHFLPMSTYFGANADRILSIGQRMGLSDEQIMAHGFFAGTMFLAKLSALTPLLGLSIDAQDFEPEQGQKDGTLAHALERVMALSVTASGARIAASDDLTAAANFERKYAYARRRRRSKGLTGKIMDSLRDIERAARPYMKSLVGGR